MNIADILGNPICSFGGIYYWLILLIRIMFKALKTLCKEGINL